MRALSREARRSPSRATDSRTRRRRASPSSGPLAGKHRHAPRRIRPVAARRRDAGADVARACRSRSRSRAPRAPAASRCSATSSCSRAPCARRSIGDHRHQRQEHGHQPGGAHGGRGRPARPRRRQPRAAGARPAGRAGAAICTCSSFRASNSRRPPRSNSPAAVVLNVTSDHMDRYASIEDYARAKSRIFAHAATVVLNADDPRVAAMRDAAKPGARVVTFSAREGGADYCLTRRGSQTCLCRHGSDLLDVSRMKITGRAQCRQRPGGAGAGRRRRPAAGGDACRPRGVSGAAAPLAVGRRSVGRALRG